MPIDMTKTMPLAAPAPDYGQIATNQIGAQKSKILADLLNSQAYQQRLPGSTLEGISRVVQAGLGGYNMNQQSQQELAARQAMISALGGDVDPFEKALVAAGNESGINSIVQARVAARNMAATRAYEDYKRQQDQAFQTQLHQQNNDAAMARMKEGYVSKEQMQQKLLDFKQEQADAKMKAGKEMNRAELNDLNAAGAANYQTSDFFNTFDNNYAGYKGLGEQAQWLGKTALLNHLPLVAMDQPAVEWWTSYQNRKNEVRKALFGSALTPKEAEEWAKADINPNMPPEQIAYNLARQKIAMERALLIKARSQIAGGKNYGQVKIATGLTDDQLQGDSLPDFLPPGAEKNGPQPGGRGTAIVNSLAAQKQQAAPAAAATLPEVTVDQGAAPAAAPAAAAPAAADPHAETLANAKAALAAGAPREAVVKRLQEAGIDPSGL